MTEIDPRTGRPFGDHGTALDAIEYALDHIDDGYDKIEFLEEWRTGPHEWKQFYRWLEEEGR